MKYLRKLFAATIAYMIAVTATENPSDTNFTQMTPHGLNFKNSTLLLPAVFSDNTSSENGSDIKYLKVNANQFLPTIPTSVNERKVVTEMAAEAGLEIKFSSIPNNRTTLSKMESSENNIGSKTEESSQNIGSNNVFDGNDVTLLKLLNNSITGTTPLTFDNTTFKNSAQDTFTQIVKNGLAIPKDKSSDNDVFMPEESSYFTLYPPTVDDDSIEGQKQNKSEKTVKHIVVLLHKQCAERNTHLTITSHILKLFYNKNSNENTSSVSCDSFLHLKLSLDSINATTIKSAIDVLYENNSLEGNYKIIKAFVTDVDLNSNDLKNNILYNYSRKNEIMTQNEIIAYTIAILSAGLLFLILITFCCIRCCSQRQTNSLDLCDIPHLNLKLEDYKLTPIPRPSISFPDYGRELLNSTYSRSRAADTILSQHHFNGGSLSNTLRRESSLGPQEMKTFNGKKSCSRVPSLDVRPQARNQDVESWFSSSREKLNSDFERKTISGIDNEGFRRWY